MIPFDEIDKRLSAIGKDRIWLAKFSDRSEGAIRSALAPNAPPERRSPKLQRALTEAIEREESAQAPKSANIPPGYTEIFRTDDELNLADQASRLVGAPSLSAFCHDVIQAEARRVIAEQSSPRGKAAS